MSVYFISARELDLVKIGYAFNPMHRYRHLRTFSPVELTLEGAIPGGYAKERELHKQFALARVRGEWFKLSPSLQAEIDASTRPEKFTWTAVRQWVKTLSEQSEALEPKTAPPEVIARVEQQMRESLALSAHRRSLTVLQRREFDGDIHFPFREMESAQ